jgi:hypothetical protein
MTFSNKTAIKKTRKTNGKMQNHAFLTEVRVFPNPDTFKFSFTMVIQIITNNKQCRMFLEKKTQSNILENHASITEWRSFWTVLS